LHISVGGDTQVCPEMAGGDVGLNQRKINLQAVILVIAVDKCRPFLPARIIEVLAVIRLKIATELEAGGAEIWKLFCVAYIRQTWQYQYTTMNDGFIHAIPLNL
jgi:hypothetical protein